MNSDDYPSRVGPYSIDKKLGQGGMAIVVQGRLHDHARPLALKIIRGFEQGNSQQLLRFLREIQILRKLKHPHLVKILDAGYDGEWVYYAMEDMTGGTLRTVLQDEQFLEEHVALALIRPIGEAIAYLHQHRTIHRDIKPSNVLLDSDGSPKVSDLGLLHIKEDTDLTALGQVIGTIRYMSPEMLGEKPITYSSDVYQLGLLLFEMLTGRPLIKPDVAFRMVAKILKGQTPRASRIRPDLDPQLEAFLMRCLHRNPDARPRDGSHFLEVLDVVIRRENGPHLRPHSYRLTPPRPIPDEDSGIEFITELSDASNTPEILVRAALESPTGIPPADPISVPETIPVKEPAKRTEAGTSPPMPPCSTTREAERDSLEIHKKKGPPTTVDSEVPSHEFGDHPLLTDASAGIQCEEEIVDGAYMVSNSSASDLALLAVDLTENDASTGNFNISHSAANTTDAGIPHGGPPEPARANTLETNTLETNTLETNTLETNTLETNTLETNTASASDSTLPLSMPDFSSEESTPGSKNDKIASVEPLLPLGPLEISRPQGLHTVPRPDPTSIHPGQGDLQATRRTSQEDGSSQLVSRPDNMTGGADNLLHETRRAEIRLLPIAPDVTPVAGTPHETPRPGPQPIPRPRDTDSPVSTLIVALSLATGMGLGLLAPHFAPSKPPLELTLLRVSGRRTSDSRWIRVHVELSKNSVCHVDFQTSQIALNPGEQASTRAMMVHELDFRLDESTKEVTLRVFGPAGPISSWLTFPTTTETSAETPATSPDPSRHDESKMSAAASVPSTDRVPWPGSGAETKLDIPIQPGAERSSPDEPLGIGLISDVDSSANPATTIYPVSESMPVIDGFEILWSRNIAGRAFRKIVTDVLPTPPAYVLIQENDQLVAIRSVDGHPALRVPAVDTDRIFLRGNLLLTLRGRNIKIYQIDGGSPFLKLLGPEVKQPDRVSLDLVGRYLVLHEKSLPGRSLYWIHSLDNPNQKWSGERGRRIIGWTGGPKGALWAVEVGMDSRADPPGLFFVRFDPETRSTVEERRAKDLTLADTVADQPVFSRGSRIAGLALGTRILGINLDQLQVTLDERLPAQIENLEIKISDPLILVGDHRPNGRVQVYDMVRSDMYPVEDGAIWRSGLGSDILLLETRALFRYTRMGTTVRNIYTLPKLKTVESGQVALQVIDDDEILLMLEENLILARFRPEPLGR